MLVIKDIWLCSSACKKVHSESELAVIFGIEKAEVFRLHKHGIRALSRSHWDASYYCPEIQNAALEIQVPIVINYDQVITRENRVQAMYWATKPPTVRYTKWRINQWPGYVYLMHWDGHYKIGMSKNPRKRMRGFSLPGKVELIHTVYSERMLLAERFLHERFAEYRESQEWFNLPMEAVQWIEKLDRAQLQELVGW